ncbi:MAG: (Fe-S)-binding protein [Bacteroidetes bacterium]|nr:(Fe-S)-binding protein [Bacteroidota bacterium]
MKLIFAIIVLTSFTGFAINVNSLIKKIKKGKPENRFNNIPARIKKVLIIAFAQTKLLRDPIPGLLHLGIYWGFIVLLIAVLESLGEGIFGFGNFSFSFLGGFYKWITFSQEIFCLIVILSIIFSLWRRFVSKIKRLQVDKYGSIDAALILIWIGLIVTTLLFQNATRISLSELNSSVQYPISSILANNFTNFDSTLNYEQIFWWSHIILVLGFLNYLPNSKHLHILTSIPNVFFTNLNPIGALKPINLSDETITTFGAKDVQDLTWKQLLDSYTCTECGRCDSVCPATLTGKALSPRKIITDTRNRADNLNSNSNSTLLYNFISEEELWACTTCMACVYECPVLIEHVDEIVDLRRGMVLNDSNFPPELKTTFDNLERNFSPWGFPHEARANWSEGKNINSFFNLTELEQKKVEILFWVGCAGAYDDRYKKVTQSFAELMNLAKINFAILGKEEKCTGDPARRMGNEYLAQMLITENVTTLNSYNIKKIVTTCPHCLQSLKKEYPQFGGNYEVIHHTEFISQLINDGKLNLNKINKEQLTYHDSCYLARYNNIIDAPREALNSVPGLEIIEMSRSKDKTFCCGAGGGRMWMEETTGKRINIERTEEALSTNAKTIGVACPFCLTMLTDGVKAKNAADKVVVKDIAEIILESIERN